MKDDPIANAISRDVADSLARQVRDAYPYLKTEALDRLVSKTASLITSSIQSEQSGMAASKLRINLLSLPAELRNNIYDSPRYGPDAATPPRLAPDPHKGCSIFWGAITIALHITFYYDYETDHVFVVQLHEWVRRQMVRLGTTYIGLVESVKLMMHDASDATFVDAHKQEIVEQLELAKFGFRLEKIDIQVERLKNAGLVVDRVRKRRVPKQTGWY